MDGPLALKFGMHLETIICSLFSSHERGIPARVHVHIPFLHLSPARPIVFNFYSVNGDWGLFSYELSTSRVWDIAARAHLRTRFRYL